MTRRLTVSSERWPIQGMFAIARGSKTHADVVVVSIREGNHTGRGEAVPYTRYGETLSSVIASIEALAPDIEHGLGREALANRARGAARSAIDLALHELEAKRLGHSVAARMGLTKPSRIPTAFTISVDSSEKMKARAHTLCDLPLLKIKLAGDGFDLERVREIRAAAPRAKLWVDVNEGWDITTYDALAPRFAELGVALLEQPLPAAEDHLLVGRPRPVPVCADESAHEASSIGPLANRYDVVNIKLDKAGGLTGAMLAIEAAQRAHLRIAIGCMVSTSLAIAPACLLTGEADWIDLDGSVLLERDREGGARMEGGHLVPPNEAMWGG